MTLSLFLYVIDSQQQQRLLFSTNAGIGRYMFRYNETVPSQGILPPPPGFFNVSCLLNGRPAEDIFYSIIGDSDVFQVDNATGALTVMPLDYETTMSYRFSVRCTLTVNGTDLMNIAQVDFQVIPVNEFQPQLSQSSVIVIATELDSIGKVLVSTRSDVNASVVFSATDEDEGPGGMLRFSLAFNENLTAFNVDPETGTLTVAQSLDVDNSPSGFDDIEVRLTVCDVDPPVPTCPNLVIRTFIFSSNDNNPVFTENVYRVSVLESMSSGVVIATVSCTDDDVGIGRFNNVTSSSNIFNVSSSPTSQNISLASQLDYETARNHNITLTCFDTGGFTATAMLIVTVLPVNDNGPRFIEREYFFTMSRIETTGNVIGRVEAQDNDQDVGDTITYTLTEDDNFQIQGDGSIILRDFVYILEGQVFELQAVVNDGEFSDRVPVTITVNGVFSVPEIILICMGAVIFLVLALFIIVLCCYCCVCCSRL